MLWYSAELKKHREQHLPGAHPNTIQGHLALSRVSTCKSHQTQSEGHSRSLEKSHGVGNCSSLGTGVFHGLIPVNTISDGTTLEKGLQSGKGGQKSEEPAGLYTPSALLHSRQLSRRQMWRVGTRVCKGKVVLFSDPLHALFLVCDGSQVRKRDPTSHHSISVPFHWEKILEQSIGFHIFFNSTPVSQPHQADTHLMIPCTLLNMATTQCISCKLTAADSELYHVRQITIDNWIQQTLFQHCKAFFSVGGRKKHELKQKQQKKFLLLFEIKDFLLHSVFQKSPGTGGKSMYFYNINNTIKIGCEAAANYLPYATLPPTAVFCLVGLLNYNVQSPLYSCVAYCLNCCWKGILGEWKSLQCAAHINDCPY